LVKEMELEWIREPSSVDHYKWGCMDVDEYANYDDPINGYIHEVVPGKFLASEGPADLSNHYYQDEACSTARSATSARLTTQTFLRTIR
jgi:hypothetical protein